MIFGGRLYLGGEAAHLQHGVQPLAQQRRVVVQRAQDDVQLVNLHMRIHEVFLTTVSGGLVDP